MTAPATEQFEAEGPVVTRVDWAPVPRVNLLPREILENRRFRNVQVGLAAGVLVTLCAAGAAFWWSDREVTESRDRLGVVQSRTIALQAEQRTYSEVPETLAALEYAETARATAMANDIAWYRYLTDLEDAAPADVAFQSLSLRVAGPAAEGTTGASATENAAESPFKPAGAVGSISIQGISGTYPKVAQWMDSLEKVTGLDVSTLDNATRGTDTGGGVTFSSGITVTDKALSHRYDRKAS